MRGHSFGLLFYLVVNFEKLLREAFDAPDFLGDVMLNLSGSLRGMVSMGVELNPVGEHNACHALTLGDATSLCYEGSCVVGFHILFFFMRCGLL